MTDMAGKRPTHKASAQSQPRRMSQHVPCKQRRESSKERDENGIGVNKK